ncbi:beta-ketoacyl synthase N-terminal-like domain-containing protein [Actinocrispum wychmicini]|uniref:Phosphopantetheine binding protein n=1 Tax=Actinocrispum wychmicini TaxID=1213861 RepID=A0A4R2IMV5_9PSEU|nr:beta-ketoacyl synthase N-terminal-like domain-containing protein [Actinocrispum wychmicini]TCO45308.1 phosphopantetheine binding protein [Actinocrispum wychmicini]
MADRDTHIAVIGMAGRFAGAPDLDTFWHTIVNGISTVRELAPDELLGEDPARMADPAYVRRFGKLDRAEWFDADFFGYAPVDAMLTDPQQRIFLECCWQAMEDAGYPPTATDSVVGVYAGCGQSRYWTLVGPQLHRFPGLDDVRLGMVTGADHLCLRVSHKLGLTGPSMTVLTTCSSSLVAAHQACQALLVGDCDMALAGGVAVRTPAWGSMARTGNVLSPDGVCRAFDAEANGTVFGDGAGVVVLKRFDDAVADGDHIHAVIRGSAVNNDGQDRIGYGAPGVSGQVAVIKSAMAAAEVTADMVDYVESHGTGTQVGDPIEVTALNQAMGSTGSTVLGTLKPNIGHTDAASGIAGLLKVILALRHRVLPPSIHFASPNPTVDFGRFTVITQPKDWSGHDRIAGVSSFGIGATNAHVVVEEAPARAAGVPMPQRLLVISAKTAAALDQATRDLADHLAAHPDQDMDDIAYTLQTGRVEFPYRRYAVVTGHSDAASKLTDGPVVPPVHRRGEFSGATDLAQVGEEWLSGAVIPWHDLPAGRRRKVPLPTYPFQRGRYIVEPVETQRPQMVAAPAGHDAAETVAMLFAEVLQTPEVADDDDFFELGGDSLTAVGLIARIEDTFGVTPELAMLFDHPTPAGVAHAVQDLLEDNA